MKCERGTRRRGMLDTYPSCRNWLGRSLRGGGVVSPPLKREDPAFRHGEDVTRPLSVYSGWGGK